VDLAGHSGGLQTHLLRNVVHENGERLSLREILKDQIAARAREWGKESDKEPPQQALRLGCCFGQRWCFRSKLGTHSANVDCSGLGAIVYFGFERFTCA
jgi:hypothetical protein